MDKAESDKDILKKFKVVLPICTECKEKRSNCNEKNHAKGRLACLTVITLQKLCTNENLQTFY